jgi:hypothetical protein
MCQRQGNITSTANQSSLQARSRVPQTSKEGRTASVLKPGGAKTLGGSANVAEKALIAFVLISRDPVKV